MKGALPDFGAIIVTVDTKDGVPVSARTRSTRAELVVRQFDACVPFRIETESANA